MDLKLNDNMRSLIAFFAMVIVGVLVLLAIGELAKYVIPDDSRYFLLVNKIYIIAAAIFVMLLGIDKINMNGIRNLVAIFALVLIGVVVLYNLDKIASGLLWNGIYPSAIGRIPEKYFAGLLQSLDALSIALGAFGAFLLLLKGLDKVKDVLMNASKGS